MPDRTTGLDASTLVCGSHQHWNWIGIHHWTSHLQSRSHSSFSEVDKYSIITVYDVGKLVGFIVHISPLYQLRPVAHKRFSLIELDTGRWQIASIRCKMCFWQLLYDSCVILSQDSSFREPLLPTSNNYRNIPTEMVADRYFFERKNYFSLIGWF